MKRALLVTLMLIGCHTPGRPQAAAPVADGSTPREPNGPDVLGVFRGRTPCKEIAAEIGLAVRQECIKRKLALTLFHDPATRQPTTFKIKGLGDTFTEGKWTMVNGTPKNPRAVIYQLTVKGTEKTILLLRGDDNVLFFLKSDHTLLVGNADFSYTLNRQEHPTKWPGYVAP